MPLLFLAFTVLPFVELFLLIRIGRVIGAGSTIAFVIAMGILGAALAKTQGRKVLEEWRTSLAAGRAPEEGVLGGVLVLVGGLLLIMPGVLSDVAGFLCLLPPTRRVIARALSGYLARSVAQGRVQVHQYGFQWPPSSGAAHSGPSSRPAEATLRGDVIDTEGEEISKEEERS